MCWWHRHFWVQRAIQGLPVSRRPTPTVHLICSSAYMMQTVSGLCNKMSARLAPVARGSCMLGLICWWRSVVWDKCAVKRLPVGGRKILTMSAAHFLLHACYGCECGAALCRKKGCQGFPIGRHPAPATHLICDTCVCGMHVSMGVTAVQHFVGLQCLLP
jgi:hypothetical protein